jgi:capsular polysaccharide transport system permease protein
LSQAAENLDADGQVRRLEKAKKPAKAPEPEPSAADLRLASVTAQPAKWRPRHYGVLLSFMVLVALPVLLSSVYLWGFAQPQYASTTGFVVRHEETSASSEMLGGLGQFMGGAASAGNSDLLFAFIQSQEIVERVQSEFDLLGHFTVNWPMDPLYSIWPDATIEDLTGFWNRMIRITYEQAAGMILVEARARDAETARTIAELVIAKSEDMINALNEAARRDSMVNAQRDLDEALSNLRSAREAMVAFQARTQILDPQADIQGRMGVLANLQNQLAEALVEYDLLLQTSDETDPRVRAAERRIGVIEERIISERQTSAAQNVTVDNTDYPTLLANYEGLRVDVLFAEESYRAALAALAAARTNAERQQVYLATFISPTMAQRADYPQRWSLVGLTLFFSMMAWAVFTLIFYSLRDRG